jgi:hypothetical protein
MRIFILSIFLLFSFSLLSQSDVAKETSDETYYPEDEEVVEDTKLNEANEECNCDIRQAQEQAPVYIIMPEPVTVAPVQNTAPAPIDYTQPQFQSGNYQFQAFPQ